MLDATTGRALSSGDRSACSTYSLRHEHPGPRSRMVGELQSIAPLLRGCLQTHDHQLRLDALPVRSVRLCGSAPRIPAIKRSSSDEGLAAAAASPGVLHGWEASTSTTLPGLREEGTPWPEVITSAASVGAALANYINLFCPDLVGALGGFDQGIAPLF